MKKRRTLIFENMLSQVNGGMDGAMKAAEQEALQKMNNSYEEKLNNLDFS